MGTELVSETSGNLHILVRLSARENLVENKLSFQYCSGYENITVRHSVLTRHSVLPNSPQLFIEIYSGYQEEGDKMMGTGNMCE
jgi:hypothetical protein